MMSLLHPYLDAFIAVVQAGSITGGAQSQKLTQTAMTQKIRSLESSLGFSVFTRSRTGVRLTEEGARLYEHVLKIKQWQGEWASQTEINTVTISGPSSLMRCRIIPSLTPVLVKNAKLKIQFDLADNDSPILKLKTGEAQIVLVKPEEVMLEMDSKLLKPERYILVGPSSWKKRKTKDILESESIVDFDREDKMTFDFLDKYNLKSRPDRCFANNTDALMALIQRGVGYSVMSEEFVKNELKKGELIDLFPGKFIELKMALCFYPQKFMPGYLKSIIQSLH